MSGPPKHALPLLKALETWGEEGDLVDSLCRSGTWRCWARRGSPDGPWDELWSADWVRKVAGPVQIPIVGITGHFLSPEGLRVVDPDFICRLELRKVRKVQRDDEIKTFKRLTVAEKWYSPVFAPRAPAMTPGDELERDFRRWVASLGGRIPGRDECIAIMRARHPDASGRAILRLKNHLAHGGKGGRPAKGNLRSK